MLDSRPCKVSSAEQLDTEIQDIGRVMSERDIIRLA